jgi:hypothetical protein
MQCAKGGRSDQASVTSTGSVMCRGGISLHCIAVSSSRSQKIRILHCSHEAGPYFVSADDLISSKIPSEEKLFPTEITATTSVWDQTILQ